MLDSRAEYARRLEVHEANVARRERQHIRLGNAKLAVAAAALALIGFYFAKHISGYWVLLPLLAFIVLAILHEQVIRARTHAQTAADFYRKGFARMEDRWSGTGSSGDRFRDSKHVYADDLDLFGRSCLFELLSTARLPMGENRLAEWLLSPSPIQTIVGRQALVAELRPKLDLREALAIIGEDLRVRMNPESLKKWCEEKALLGGTGLRILCVALSVAVVAGLYVYFVTTHYALLLAVLFIEALLYAWLHKRASTAIEGVNANAEGLELFSKILLRIEQESFASPQLQPLVAGLRQAPEPASRAVRRFAHIVDWIDGHDSLVARLLDLPMLYTIQTAVAAEAWRKQHGRQMRAWIDAVAEV